ncbi:circularly permutated Ras protein 1-like isoform X3 [Rana temporaria]|uniref:circularly permutated Ras protein 1-like isoform X3 n=1 Tax=Rana temporaria TaxID=8407 RepID=UPI001AAD2CC2|nr:circularly permutated Ras protein 1-like isoform X3 [Rana temporaria]
MEFGCRYIYVDESRGDVQQHCHPSSVNIPQKGIDVPDQAPYDNFMRKGSACSEVNGLSQTGPSPDSNVHLNFQPGSVNTGEQWNTLPPVPDRKKKPSFFQNPGVHEPDLSLYDNFGCKADSASTGKTNELPSDLTNNRLSPEANVYQGLQLPPSPIPGRKPPPPIPERKKKPSVNHTDICTPSAFSSLLPTSKGFENGPAPTAFNMMQQNPPPIPLRKSKPSEYRSETHQDSHLYMDVPSAESTDLGNSTQDWKPTGHRAPVIPLVSIASDKSVYSNFYLDVLPAVPVDLEMQKTPPRTPTRPLTPSPPSPVPPPEQRLPANCNILHLRIGKLVEDPGKETLDIGFPLLCSKCSAAFSELSHVEDNKTWTCDFCSTENAINEHTQLECTGDNQLYLHEMAGNVYTTDEDNMLIFCIDISGSMSVTIEVPQDQTNNCNNHNIYQSRMEAVKSGLIETLHFLHKQHPRRRVALVTFSDHVKIYGDGTIQPQVLEDCELLDTDYLKSQGENQPVPQILGETLHVLEAQILSLQENGATALGPAALVSIAMASKRPGSKVIICTDGRANTDLGNLEDITEEYIYRSSKLYYSNLGDLALQHSVVVSVVTIEGTDCRLPELGQLADKTGGKVNIVHPLNLANEFQSILDEQIIATDVEVKVYLPHSMHFLYEGHNESVLTKKIGSMNPDTGLSTEFAIHSSKTKEALRHSQLPVQVQITFTLPDGRARHRIISQKRPVTNDSVAALEAINLNVLQIHSVQFCARLAMEGHVNEATKVALELKEIIEQVMRHEKYEDQGVTYEDWENTMAPIYEDLQVYRQEESSKNDVDTTKEVPVLKSFSDEMAKMIFHMKRTKSKVLNRWKHQAE